LNQALTSTRLELVPSGRKLDLVGELGAEVVVDYSEPGWEERVRAVTGHAGAELVFDGAGGQIGRSAFEVTARGGRFSAHGAGRLTPVIGKTFPLERAADAHTAIEARSVLGKTLLLVDGSDRLPAPC
jgi:NADPH:quinone reductase